ncbi:MAG: hypothetical protein A4E48_01230 [Methanosaeta sp. PtaU1.Bin060]|nr:MAG: hypothetical protein A4E48_01230 [Methanosaeta sp. PtaU1.Bin060]
MIKNLILILLLALFGIMLTTRGAPQSQYLADGEGWYLQGDPVITKDEEIDLPPCSTERRVTVSNGRGHSSVKLSSSYECFREAGGTYSGDVTWTSPPAYMKPGSKIDFSMTFTSPTSIPTSGLIGAAGRTIVEGDSRNPGGFSTGNYVVPEGSQGSEMELYASFVGVCGLHGDVVYKYKYQEAGTEKTTAVDMGESGQSDTSAEVTPRERQWCKEAGYFYTDAEMEKIYGGDGKTLNYDRDQLVNMMISAMEKYKTEGGSVDGGIINYYDSIALLASFYSGASPTGREADLKNEAQEYCKGNGLLTPGDLFYIALKVCKGNVRDALVTAHAVLYRDGGGKNEQFIKEYLVPLRNPEAYNDADRFIKSSKKKDERGNAMLVTPREAMGDDQQGVWYHLFGTAAIQFQDEVNVVPWALTRWTMEEGMPLADKIPGLNLKALIPPHISEMKEWESKSEIGTMLSNYALALENLVRSSGGSPVDPDKQCINYAGVAIGEALRKYIGRQSLDLGISEPGQIIAGESLSLGSKVTILGMSPISFRIEGKNGEVFSLDQANKHFSGNTLSVILDPFIEDDGTIGLLATPLFEIKNIEVEAIKSGDATIGLYSYGDKMAAARSIKVQKGDSYSIDLTQFIGQDGQPQIILDPAESAGSKPYESATEATDATEPREGKVIYNSWNLGYVDNSPTCSPFFTIDEPQMITYIDTYHWNFGTGAPGGMIGLRNDDGILCGPWEVETAFDDEDVPKGYWIAHPNEVIPAGSYTVEDSDPETWSQNSESPCGFTKIEGYPSDPATSPAIRSSIDTVGNLPSYKQGATDSAEDREESGAVLIDEEKEKTITTRQPLKLAEGYVLKINRIDVDRDNVYLDLLKGDEIVDSGIVSPNDPVGDNKIYRYTRDVGKSQAVTLIEIHFKNAFHGAEQDLATISRVFQISESSFGDN